MYGEKLRQGLKHDASIVPHSLLTSISPWYSSVLSNDGKFPSNPYEATICLDATCRAYGKFRIFRPGCFTDLTVKTGTPRIHRHNICVLLPESFDIAFFTGRNSASEALSIAHILISVSHKTATKVNSGASRDTICKH